MLKCIEYANVIDVWWKINISVGLSHFFFFYSVYYIRIYNIYVYIFFELENKGLVLQFSSRQWIRIERKITIEYTVDVTVVRLYKRLEMVLLVMRR